MVVDSRNRIRLHPVERARPPLRSVYSAMWKLARRHPLVLIAFAMLTVDLAFIVIQIAVDATDYGFNGAFRLSLETEMGVAQFYGWVKAGAAAFLLLGAWRRYHSPSIGLWMAALAYLGVDDAMRLHERLGTFFAERLGLSEVGSLRGQDIGEVMAYVLIIAVAFTALIAAERRDQGRFPTMTSMVMAPVVAVFLFFAVVLDTAGSIVPIAIEDGGELVMLTVLFVTAFIWSQQADELTEFAS